MICNIWDSGSLRFPGFVPMVQIWRLVSEYGTQIIVYRKR